MIIGEEPKVMSDSYKNDPMRPFVESYVQLTEGLLTESTDVYTEPVKAFVTKNTNEALKQFFVEGSYDQAAFTEPEE